MPKIVGSGRKQAPEWQEVARTSNSCKVKCKHCQSLLTAKIERVCAHLKMCKSRETSSTVPIVEEQPVPEPDQNIECEEVSSNLDSSTLTLVGNTSTCSTTLSKTFHQPSPISSSTPKKRKIKQLNLENFACTTSEAQKKEIDCRIAKFFYANSIAFRAADSQQYKDMVKSLRPGYNPPSRKDLAGKLLDDVHDNIEDGMKETLADATITLMQDGWSSVKKMIQLLEQHYIMEENPFY